MKMLPQPVSGIVTARLEITLFQVRARLKDRTDLETALTVFKIGTRKGDCNVKRWVFDFSWLRVRVTVLLDWRFVLAVTTLVKVLLR
jgi:hypothetical protein